ncbi:hypothetical protein D3C71_2242020 [compost metagenome]
MMKMWRETSLRTWRTITAAAYPTYALTRLYYITDLDIFLIALQMSKVMVPVG